MQANRRQYLVAIIFALFFVISFITNFLGSIVPDLISSFHLSLASAAVLPFSFFIAYGVCSIPAGIAVERWQEKAVLLAALNVAFVGAALFASMPVYTIAVPSLFLIGGSMATLQVAANPLLRSVGGEERFAFNSAFGQLVFGAASFLSPHSYTLLASCLSTLDANASYLAARIIPVSMPWVGMYWIFAALLLFSVMMLLPIRFPAAKNREPETSNASSYLALIKRPAVWLYFWSVFFYVGSEQGTANWMSEFLLRYHRLDPHKTGVSTVAWFWGLLTAGNFLRMFLLKLLDSRTVLRIFGVGALLSITVALFGPATLSIYAFACIGLFASVMWPILISLALNSVLEHHGPFTGILCTGIMGGAIIPFLIGFLADHLGLRIGMSVLYLTFGWVLSVSFWARPLIPNQRIGEQKVQPIRPLADPA